MKTVELSYPESIAKQDLPEAVCAIGFFDGVHKGHQDVIKSAVSEARESGMESVVITFHPHPSVILKQNTEPAKYITPLNEKKEMLETLNVDRLYIIKFNKELSLLSPKDFIDHFIIGLNIKHLVAGFDFTYGHKGQGNMENIITHSNGFFSTTVIPKLEENDQKISSTRIRHLLKSGKINEANQLLGRPFRVRGKVIDGDKRGRKIGFPTANLQVLTKALLPKVGVYAVTVQHNNRLYKGMANLGVKPTFKSIDKNLSLEVFIFDFTKDIYNKEVIVEFYTFIRNEQKFSGVDELVNQLTNDEKIIRKFFSEENNV